MNLTHFLTPTNLAQEKERFFASSTYSPQLEYNWKGEEINGDTPKHKLAQAAYNQNFPELIRRAQEVFSTQIQADFLAKARHLLQSVPEKRKTPPVQEIIKSFEQAFFQLGLTEYELFVTEKQGFNFRPAPQEKKIVMSALVSLEYFSVDGEIKHELTHIIRYENGKHNMIEPSANSLPTEEGLATYFQDFTGEDGQASAFQHAAEYAMTEVVLHGSFRDLFAYLLEIGFSPELAWQRGIRHKFGWQDTSQPGDIMKPSMYFYHQQKIAQLSDDERFRLLAGKIAVEELPQHHAYAGRFPLPALREFY